MPKKKARRARSASASKAKQSPKAPEPASSEEAEPQAESPSEDDLPAPPPGVTCEAGVCSWGKKPRPGADDAPAEPLPKEGPALWLGQAFGVDLRSLALFRAGLGLLVLGDLAMRAPWLTEHYSDAGLTPRSELADLARPWLAGLSLHALGGSALFQAFLFGLAAALALMLIVGWRARLAAGGLFVLTASLHARNPAILVDGDSLLRIALFWAMFLPLGAHCAVDAALLGKNSRRPPIRVAHMGTAAFSIQVAMVYVFAAWGYWNAEGSAGPFAMPLAAAAILSLGLLVPSKSGAPRAVAFAMLLCLHAFLGAWGAAPQFFLAFLVCLAAFAPTLLWEKFFEAADTREWRGIKMYYDYECSFCTKMGRVYRQFLLPRDAKIIPCQDDPSILADMEQYNSWVVVDKSGKRRYKFDAVAFMAGASPFFWPFEPLLRWGPAFRLGDWFYENVANNRYRMGFIVKLLHFREQTTRQSWAGKAIAGALIAFVIAWNLQAVGALALPEPLHEAVLALRLDQDWPSAFLDGPAGESERKG